MSDRKASPSDRKDGSVVEWRPIPGYPGYEASTLGEIRGPKGLMRGSPDHGGYLRVSFYSGAKKVSVHSLVLEAFVGPYPRGFHREHIDGNKLNNRLSNLRYSSRARNEASKVAHGTSNRGERCATSRLTERQAREILRVYDPARRGHRAELSRQYGVSYLVIHLLVTRKTWGWL